MSETGSSSQAGIRLLVAQLADFSTRARARTQLLLAGQAAVPALMDALESPVEGVAWSAAKTLGEIGHTAAVDALKSAMARPALKEVAAEALQRITGSQAAGTDAAQAGALADEDFARALARGRTTVEKTHTGFSFVVRLANGRKQKVDMTLSLRDSDGSPLVALYTECGAATPDRYEWALKTNLKIPFGAFALRDTAQGTRFVMVDAYLREAATQQQLVRAIEMLAKRADALEETISGSDEA